MILRKRLQTASQNVYPLQSMRQNFCLFMRENMADVSSMLYKLMPVRILPIRNLLS